MLNFAFLKHGQQNVRTDIGFFLLQIPYARLALDSFTDAEFSADFRVSGLLFDFIVQTLRPHWKGRLQIITGVLCSYMMLLLGSHTGLWQQDLGLLKAQWKSIQST